jgi:NAD(P)H-binding
MNCRMLRVAILLLYCARYALAGQRGAFVIGGTGRLGRLVISKLVAENYPVVALVRNETLARELTELRGARLVSGDVSDMNSLNEAMRSLDMPGVTKISIIDVHGVKPPRFSRISDLFGGQAKNHPREINYQGVLNLLALMRQESGRFDKIVRVTGALVGRPSNLFAILFNLVLSFSNKYHQLSEIAIRSSGVDYSIVRPTGIRVEARAREMGRRLIIASGRGDDVPIPGKISALDLSDLCVICAEPSKLSRATVVVSSCDGQKLPQKLETWLSWTAALEARVGPTDDEVTSLAPHRVFASLFASGLVSIAAILSTLLFKGLLATKTFAAL